MHPGFVKNYKRWIKIVAKVKLFEIMYRVIVQDTIKMTGSDTGFIWSDKTDFI